MHLPQSVGFVPLQEMWQAARDRRLQRKAARAAVATPSSGEMSSVNEPEVKELDAASFQTHAEVQTEKVASRCWSSKVCQLTFACM